MALTDRRILFRAAVAVVLVSAVGLSACGRKGPLQPPPSASAVDGESGEKKPDDSDAKDRPFALDFLI